MSVYLTEDGCHVHCPYCILALPEDVEKARLAHWRAGTRGLPCPRCKRDLLGDAPLEVPATRRVTPAPCHTCSEPIDPRAIFCHHCGARQPPQAR